MRVSQLLSTAGDRPVISFEFSRPKTEKGAASLEKGLDTLATENPDYVSVTFGAGGSTREGSFELVEALKSGRGLPTVAYLAAVGLGPEDLEYCLDRFAGLGIETIFAIRGDAPTWEEDYRPHPEALPHASDLLAFIRARHDFCLGGAIYPEGHLEAESLERDLEHVKLKVENGAEYLVAQYFYDNDTYYKLVDKARAAGIEVPIVPGIMPIYSVKLMENLARICGTTITDEVRQGLAAIDPEDNQAVAALGVELATRQCRDLLQHGVPGLHFYTMNRARAVAAVLGTLRAEGLLP